MRVGCYRILGLDNTIEMIVANCGVSVALEKPLKITSINGRGLVKKSTFTITLDRNESQICSRIGQFLDVPWCYFMLQENSFWEVVFYKGSNEKARFSVMPEAWESDSGYIQSWTISDENIQKIARDWEVDPILIKKYFIPWREIYGDKLTNYTDHQIAYPDDKKPYGSVYQAFDLLVKLGAGDPSNIIQLVSYNIIYFVLIPEPESNYVRHGQPIQSHAYAGGEGSANRACPQW